MQSSQLTGSSQFLGTPDYTAPEQIEGAAADTSLFGLAGVFTPPTTAGRWQEATSVAFSPGGKTLATSDTNGSAYLWRVR